MNNVLRWALLLPVACVAILVVNGVVVLTIGTLMPEALTECVKSGFGTFGFIAAAYMMAPRGKFITALIVGSGYNAVGIFVIVVNILQGDNQFPVWEEILMISAAVAATAAACSMAHSYESDRKADLLKGAQKN